MNSIIEKFFDLFEEDLISLNWNKSNISFSLVNGSRTMDKIVQEINKGISEEDDSISEREIVEAFFAIMTNRVGRYYQDDVANNEDDNKITEYIETSVNSEILKEINKNIYFDNSILNNRFEDIKYEIITKRDSNDLNNIKGYTARLVLENLDVQRDKNIFELELKLNELEKIINTLTKAKEDIDYLNK